MLRGYTGIPAEARYLAYLTFFTSLAQGLVYTDLAYFLTQVRGLSDLFMGTIIAVIGVTMVICSTPLGILADRFGRRRLLIVGNVFASLTIALFAVSSNPDVLLAAAVIEGFTEGAFASSSSALIAEKAGDSARTNAFSLMAFLSSTAWGIAGFVLPVVLVLEDYGASPATSHEILYLAFAALSLASTTIMLRVKESSRVRSVKRLSDFVPRKSKRLLLRYGSTSAILAFGAGMFVPLMSRWFDLRYGLSDSVSGPIIGVSSFLVAAGTLAAPSLARRFGVVKAIVFTEGISSVFMVATPLSPSYVAAGVVYSIRSFMMNLANPLMQSMVMGLVPEDERGAASGVSAAIWRLPNSISSGIGADLMGAGLLATPFYAATLLYTASISLFWHFFKKAELPEERPHRQDSVERRWP